MSKIYTEQDVISDLGRRCDGYGKRKKLAFLIDVQPSNITHILSGIHGISKNIADKLGYEVVYRKKK